MYSVGKNYVVIDCNVSFRLNPSHGVQRGFRRGCVGLGVLSYYCCVAKQPTEKQLKGNVADCIVSEYTLVFFSHDSHDFRFPQRGA